MPLLSASAAVRAGFAALRTNPLRTFLSALGVVIGVGAMIAVLALSDGVETSIRERLAADGRVLTLRVEPRTTEYVDGLTLPRASFPVFGPREADALGAAVAGAGTADLSVAGPAFVTLDSGGRRRGMLLRGMRLTPPQLRNRPPAAGRFFTETEGMRGARVLVLSDALAGAFATPADSAAEPALLPSNRADRAAALAARPRHDQPTAAACYALIGRTVTVAGAPWRIVGVLQPTEDTPTACTGKPAAPRFRAGPSALTMFAIAPAAAVLEAVIPIPGRSVPPTLVVTATRVEELPALRKSAEGWLASRYGKTTGASGGWKDSVEVASYERESEGIRQGMLVFRLLMSAITGISLVVGGVGIMNVLLASVTERTREIGINKAVGARRRDVLAQYLAESVAISAVGAVLGTALGYGVAQIIAAIMRSQATMSVHAGFSLSTLLVAIGAPLVVGLCFGMYPALRASRLSPIDAIRHE